MLTVEGGERAPACNKFIMCSTENNMDETEAGMHMKTLIVVDGA